MMRVMSFNMNGIRSSARKGFFDWFLTQDIDVLCVQETKAQMAHLTDEVLRPTGYTAHFADAQKKRLQWRGNIFASTAGSGKYPTGLGTDGCGGAIYPC